MPKTIKLFKISKKISTTHIDKKLKLGIKFYKKNSFQEYTSK